MTQRLALILLAVLGGCNPVAYVPAPSPAAPRASGVWASGTLDGPAAQATGQIAVAPVPGVAVLARGVYGNTSALSSEAGNGSYVQRGFDVGAVAAHALSARAAVELGATVGRDRMDMQEGSFDVGCCSQTFRPLRATTDRIGGHAGLWLGAPGGVEAGPVLRVTRTSTRVGAEGDAYVGTFAEPGVRVRAVRGPFDLTVHGGLSLSLSDGYGERFSHVPLVGGVGVAYRIHRFGP